MPTCAVWPGQIAAGTRSRRIAVTMDLFPTICAAAAAEWKQTIDGQSILPTLLGQEPLDVERDVFFHRREGNLRYAGLTIQALRRGDWKLVRNSPFAPVELYNLKDDPREQRDLSKEKPRVFRRAGLDRRGRHRAQADRRSHAGHRRYRGDPRSETPARRRLHRAVGNLLGRTPVLALSYARA